MSTPSINDTNRLTGKDRVTIARARHLAFAGTTTRAIREITEDGPDAPDAMVYSNGLSTAQALLLEMVEVAERLSGRRASG